MERDSFILWVSFLLILLWSCDTSLPPSPDEEPGESAGPVSGAAMQQPSVSIDRGASHYTCSVYTRLRSGSESGPHFHSSVHFFPEEMVERSRGQTTKRVFIITGDPSVGELQSDWSYAGYDHVLQTATCRLPAVEGIEQEMIRRFTEIAPGKNSRLSAVADPGAIRVHALRPDDLPEEPDEEPGLMGDPLPEPEPIPAPEGCGWYCTYYWILIHSSGGEILQVEVDCDSDSWVLECNVGDGIGDGLPFPPPPPGPGGGGGGSGGGSGDPGGTPEAPQPCDYLMEPIPWMCGDPCNTGNATLDDPNVQQAMHEAWKESYGTGNDPLPHGQRNEAMYIVTATSSGYEFDEIPPGPNTSSCHFSAPGAQIPSNAVALIHTHPYGDGDTINDPRCPSGWYNGNNVSSGDAALMQALISQGLNIPIYVIDKTKIRMIQPSNPSQYAQTINRCGY